MRSALQNLATKITSYANKVSPFKIKYLFYKIKGNNVDLT